MKKIALFSIVVLCLLTGCSTQDDIIRSLGKSTEIGFYSSDGTQDYTDYAKYHMETVTLENNPYFQPIDHESKMKLEEHLVNFENWVNTYKEDPANYEIAKYYDFDKSFISERDYLYIYDHPDYDYLENYNLYFFDFETSILYYFHSNT